MSEVYAVATSWPTAVFSVLVLVAVTYWMVSILGGLGMDGADGFDSTTDHDGFLDGVLTALHLDDVPLPLSLSLWATLAWFASFVLSRLADPFFTGTTSVLIGAFIVLLSLLVGFVPVMLLARPLRKLIRETPATTRNDLVGKVGLVVTGSVTETFGEAEVKIDGHAPAHVQVRCDTVPAPSHGTSVLLVEYSTERDAFLVVPFDSYLIQN